MRRCLLAGVLVLAFLSAAQLAFGASTPSRTPRAALQNYNCRPALQPAKRIVSVTAVMRPVSRTHRMQMRFTLLSDALGHLAPVRGGGLGDWISPQPSTLGQNPNDVWIVRHPVTRMAVPADYRFRVTFRWIAADHRTITTAVRQSPICSQPDMRPDLVVQSIKVNPVSGDQSHDQYVVQIANAGLTGVKSFEVLFAPGDGSASQTATIPRLAAHETHSLTFVGSACSSTIVPTVTVDPEHLINDLDPANNSLTATCPAPTGSSVAP